MENDISNCLARSFAEIFKDSKVSLLDKDGILWKFNDTGEWLGEKAVTIDNGFTWVWESEAKNYTKK